jgi:restriction system protein
MTIPDYQSIMLPLLRFAGDGREHSAREAIDALADEFHLTVDERKELLPSGQQATFDNRVGWARTYMKKAGLLHSPRRGVFQVTDRGVDVLEQNPDTINNAFLKQFPEFIEFTKPGQTAQESATGIEPKESEQTPEEQIEAAYQNIRQDLAAELLESVKSCSPSFFERLVVDLLVKMGYGGTRRDAGRAIGRSGDEGIDGIINEDRLGLDVVYVQAKRWDEQLIGRPDIQKFAGALAGQKAKKGVFITTSQFTQPARDYVSVIDSKIVLIDGGTLAELMIDFGIGVNAVTSYELKRLDLDYFTDN